MKILALDSSGLVASVAIVEDDNMLGEYTVNYKKTHSQTLLPMLDEVAKMIELDLNSIDAIAVAAGPGSFTGLRIGSATAKGLGLALDKPLIHIIFRHSASPAFPDAHALPVTDADNPGNAPLLSLIFLLLHTEVQAMLPLPHAACSYVPAHSRVQPYNFLQYNHGILPHRLQGRSLVC